MAGTWIVTLLATLVAVGLMMLALALGLLLGGRQPQGSCGGVGRGCRLCDPGTCASPGRHA